MPGRVFWLLLVLAISALGGVDASGRNQTDRGPPHVLTVIKTFEVRVKLTHAYRITFHCQRVHLQDVPLHWLQHCKYCISSLTGVRTSAAITCWCKNLKRLSGGGWAFGNVAVSRTAAVGMFSLLRWHGLTQNKILHWIQQFLLPKLKLRIL